MARRPASDPGAAEAGEEVEDAQWVRSFVRTQPGKTYRVDAADDAHEDAAREALTGAAQSLLDRILPESQTAERDDAPQSGPPS